MSREFSYFERFYQILSPQSLSRLEAFNLDPYFILQYVTIFPGDTNPFLENVNISGQNGISSSSGA